MHSQWDRDSPQEDKIWVLRGLKKIYILFTIQSIGTVDNST